MDRIYKYRVELIMRLPVGARILKFDYQNKVPMVWAEVDTGADMIPVKMMICGTGDLVPEHMKYVGTAFNDPFVWHLYVDTDTDVK